MNDHTPQLAQDTGNQMHHLANILYILILFTCISISFDKTIYILSAKGGSFQKAPLY